MIHRVARRGVSLITIERCGTSHLYRATGKIPVAGDTPVLVIDTATSIDRTVDLGNLFSMPDERNSSVHYWSTSFDPDQYFLIMLPDGTVGLVTQYAVTSAC